MITKIRHLPAALLSLGLLCCLNVGLAQVPAPPDATKPRPTHTLRIALADARSPLRELVIQSGEKVFQPAKVNPFQISEPLTLKVMPELLKFFAKGAVEAAESAEALASVAVPAGLHYALVVLAPKGNGNTPALHAFLINEGDFPDQSIWFLNGSTNQVAIQIAADKHTIAAGGAELVQPKLKGTDALSVQAFFYEKDKWQIFSSTRWMLPSGQRHLVFFHVNPRTLRMDYNSLTDFIPK